MTSSRGSADRTVSSRSSEVRATLQDADLLLTIAEVAVSFTGFASLVASWHAGRVAILRWFRPPVPHRLGLTDDVIWRMSSGLLAIAGVGIT